MGEVLALQGRMEPGMMADAAEASLALLRWLDRCLQEVLSLLAWGALCMGQA